MGDDDGLWSPAHRQLTLGLVLTITLVAFESLAVAIVMPEVESDLGGLALYGWVFSGFFLASLLGIVVAGQLADRRGLAFPFRILHAYQINRPKRPRVGGKGFIQSYSVCCIQRNPVIQEPPRIIPQNQRTHKNP